MRPAVSIIVPVFNRLRYLRVAIDSVFEQSFLDWELLIADDGSGPDMQDYLQTLAERPNVRVLRLSHSGIPGAVRNAALRDARGEYIAFLDSDDVWVREKLQMQIDSLRAHREREWSYTAFTLTNDAGNPRAAVRAPGCGACHGPLLDQLVREAVIVVTPSVVARRELIERAGGFNSELLVGEDYELWIRLASLSEAVYVDRPLVLVRRHGEHSFDDITCLENLMRAIELVRHSGHAAHLDAVLNKRRAKIAANLARAHALSKSRLLVLSTLSASARYSWRYASWWRAAIGASLRAFVPEAAIGAARKCRRDRLAERKPQA